MRRPCARGGSRADLAAHLVVRERRPDSGPGIVWPPLAGYTDKVRRSLKERTTWSELVENVRHGPPMLLRPFDGPMNTVEFFIHVEDVRRAQPQWEPRPLSDELADALWARVGPGGMAKKVPATIVITSPGRPEKVAGYRPATGAERGSGRAHDVRSRAADRRPPEDHRRCRPGGAAPHEATFGI